MRSVDFRRVHATSLADSDEIIRHVTLLRATEQTEQTKFAEVNVSCRMKALRPLKSRH